MYLSQDKSAAERCELLNLCETDNKIGFRNHVVDLISQYGTSSQTLDYLQVLHYSVLLNIEDLVLQLLSLGCSPFFCDYNGDSALHYACKGANLSFINEIYERYGLDALNIVNLNGYCLLLSAVAEAQSRQQPNTYKDQSVISLCEWLYLHGFSLESQDKHGRTALHLAVIRGSKSLVQWLLSRGAHLGHRDFMNMTVLHHTATTNSVSIAAFLCKKGAAPLLSAASKDTLSNCLPRQIAWNRNYWTLALFYSVWESTYKNYNYLLMLHSHMCLTILIGLLNIVVLLLFPFYSKFSLSGYISTWSLLLSVFASAFTVITRDPGAEKPVNSVIPVQKCCNNIFAEIESFRTRIEQSAQANCESSYRLSILEYESKLRASEIAEFKTANGAIATNILQDKFAGLEQIQIAMRSMRTMVMQERCANLESMYLDNLINNSSAICVICQINQLCRSKHCSQCNICVKKFDHHCVWLDNCIGINNQVCFLSFCFSVVFYEKAFFSIIISLLHSQLASKQAILAAVTTTTASRFSIIYNIVHRLISLLNVFSIIKPVIMLISLLTRSPTLAVFLMFIVLLNFAAFIFTLYLSIRTCRSMMTNLTFYEGIRPGPHVIQRYGKSFNNSYLWDFKGLSFIQIILNIIAFLTQSSSQDNNTFPPYQQNVDSYLINKKLDDHPTYYNNNNNNSGSFMWNISNFGNNGQSSVTRAQFHV